MKATRRIMCVVAIALLAVSSLYARVSLSSIAGKTGVGRFFQMAFSGPHHGGIVVDGIKAGVDALLDLDGENTVALKANATAAARTGASVMTFNASLHREAEFGEDMTLFVETGVETHLILHTGVSTELGIACMGGASYEVAEGLDVVVSAGLTDMFFSTAVKTLYGTVEGSVGTYGLSASVECRYKF